MFVFGTCGEHHGSLGLSTHDQTRPASPGRAAILLAAAWAMLLSGVQAHPGEYVFGHGVAFLHELKYPAGFEHFEYINPGAPKGGALVLPTMRPFNTVSPLANERAMGVPGAGLAFDTLLVRAGDEIAAYYGNLAKEVAIRTDKRAMAFRLHPLARWHDGVPITTADVKFTFEKMLETAAGQAYLHWLDHVEVVDERLLILHTHSDPTLNLRMLSGISILPVHYWAGRDPLAATLVPTLGSGPYRIAEVGEGRSVTYERAPDYWGAELPVNRGRFNFDTIRYDVYRDATVAREALRKGLLDMWVETDIRHWAVSYDTPAHQKGWLIKGRRTYRIDIGARMWVVLNTQRAPFDDIRVREALTYALDFEWQNRVLHSMEQTRADSYFHGSPFAARGLPSDAELALLEPFRAAVPSRVFTHEFTLPQTDGRGENRRGLLRARALLAESGWRVQDGLLVDAYGRPFDIEFLSRSAEDQRTLLPFIDSLAKLGIRGKIRAVEQLQFTNRMRNRDYQAFLRVGDIGLPPWELRMGFHSSAVDQPVSFNHAGISHPAVDALIEAAVSARTLDEMIVACKALDRVMQWGFYVIPLDAVVDHRIVYWAKFGRPPPAEPMYLSPFPDGWWYDRAKASRIEVEP